MWNIDSYKFLAKQVINQAILDIKKIKPEKDKFREVEQIQNCKGKDRQRERSEITPRYADNFYKRFIQEYVETLKEAK